jgi:hypothetical protein
MKTDRSRADAELAREVNVRRSGAPANPAPDGAVSFFASLLRRLQARATAADAVDLPMAEPFTPPRAQTGTSTDAPPPAHVLVAPVALTPIATKRETPSQAIEALAPGLRQAAAHAIPAPTSGQRVVEQLVSSISDFCNDPATQGREGWNVRLELNQDLLPQTELEMSLSPQWLLLRFVPRDPTSRALVCAESDSLQQSLAATINPRRDVVVDVE